jgi:hypothetical protein
MFYKSKVLTKVWDDFELMIRDNYSYDEENDVILLGSYLKENIQSIRDKFPGKKLIIYQLEPLVSNHWWSTDRILNRIRSVDEVWDYDIENVNIIGSYKIPVKYRPFRYSESLKRIDNIPDPDIDVLFYGTLNERRLNILNSFLRPHFSKIKFVFLSNLLGDELDHFIARSKIILSLNAHDNDRQKQSRIFYPVINNKCVISEKSNVNYFGDLIIEADLKSLPIVIMDFLKNEKWKGYSNVSERYRDFCKSPGKMLELPGADHSII